VVEHQQTPPHSPERNDMNQPSLFDDAAVSRDTSAESADFGEISSISEVREIAREYI
jgi:hypothetical protein